MKSALYLLMLLPAFLSGQSRIGEWKAHVSYHSVIRITETNQSIVAATANGILLVDKKSSQLTTKTKAEGLSDIGITSIACARDLNCILIGYATGNLDLLQDGRIINFPDLTRKSGISDKTILKIVCEGNFAYLCCAFGIVKVDLKKIEVTETWYLGTTMDLKMVYDLVTYQGRWFAATNHGIFIADTENSNLQDYRNWKLQTSLPQSDAIFSSFALTDGLLFTHDKTNEKILAWNGAIWQQKYPEISKIRRINSIATGMIVLTENEVWLTGKTGNDKITSYQIGNEITKIDPEDGLMDGNGTLWIGDFGQGLIGRLGNSFHHFIPNCLSNNQITALQAGPDALFAATVSATTSGSKDASISIFQAGIWQNFSATDDPGLTSIRPVTSFAFDRDHPDDYWVSTAGSGLYYFQKNRVSANFTDLNSNLGSINGSCIVNGIAIDHLNRLIYSNPTGKVRLGSRTGNGSFVPLPYSEMNFSDHPTGEIIVSNSSTNWVVLPNEGLFAFKIKGNAEDISDDQYRKVFVKSRFTNGTTTEITQFANISTIAEDLNNELWVGTGTGVVVYNNPDKIFDVGEFYGVQPSLNDGDGLFKPILAKEKITAIVVDGGNRKWVGSATSGVFLFSAEGEHLLRHFDTRNSPLLSDNILFIALDSKSGELYFATDKGLVSYKSDATAGLNDLAKTYVWPNPVRETYDGNVTIDGLTEGTDIRITDLSGNLVFRTVSLGGRAIWNVKNAKGAKVATGVYLIFCNSSLSKTTKIVKLLVIH